MGFIFNVNKDKAKELSPINFTTADTGFYQGKPIDVNATGADNIIDFIYTAGLCNITYKTVGTFTAGSIIIQTKFDKSDDWATHTSITAETATTAVALASSDCYVRVISSSDFEGAVSIYVTCVGK